MLCVIQPNASQELRITLRKLIFEVIGQSPSTNSMFSVLSINNNDPILKRKLEEVGKGWLIIKYNFTNKEFRKLSIKDFLNDDIIVVGKYEIKVLEGSKSNTGLVYELGGYKEVPLNKQPKYIREFCKKDIKVSTNRYIGMNFKEWCNLDVEDERKIIYEETPFGSFSSDEEIKGSIIEQK